MAELIRKWRNEIPQTSRNFTSSQFCKFIQNTKLFNSTPPKQKSFYKKWPLEIFTFVFGSSNWIPSWKKDFPGIYCPLFSPNLMDARFTDPEGQFWMLYPDVSDFGFYIFDGRRFHIHIKMRFIVNLWTYRSGPKENPSNMFVSGRVFLQTFLQTTPSTVHRGFFKPKPHLFGAASHSRVLWAMGLSVVEAHACQDLQALV